MLAEWLEIFWGSEHISFNKVNQNWISASLIHIEKTENLRGEVGFKFYLFSFTARVI